MEDAHDASLDLEAWFYPDDAEAWNSIFTGTTEAVDEAPIDADDRRLGAAVRLASDDAVASIPERGRDEAG